MGTYFNSNDTQHDCFLQMICQLFDLVLDEFPKVFSLQHDFFLDLLKFHATNISCYAIANPTM